MTTVVVDTSVVLKWFHAEGEAEVTAARAVLAAHSHERLRAHVLELGLFELGNVLFRSLHWSAEDVGDQIEDLITICGPPLGFERHWHRIAAKLAHTHRLTYYDAAFAAAAAAIDAPLISADRDLLAADLAVSPTIFAKRLGSRTS